MLRRVFFSLVFMLVAPAMVLGRGNETRIANPANLETANTMIRSYRGAVSLSAGLPPLVSNLFNAQFTCQKAVFDRAKAELLERLDNEIRPTRAASNRAPFSSPWDDLLAFLLKLRDFVESLEYTECRKAPNVQQVGVVYQARAIDAFRNLMGAVRLACSSAICPDTTVRGYDWTVDPTMGVKFENMLIYQRLCDEKSFNTLKQEMQAGLESIRARYVSSETPDGIKKHSDAVNALAALDKIKFVPCGEKPKTRTAGLPSSTTTGGAGTAGGTGQGTTPRSSVTPGPQDQGPGQGTGEDESLPGMGDESLPGLDDEPETRVGLAPPADPVFTPGSGQGEPVSFPDGAASGTLVPVSTAGIPLQTFWFLPEIEIKFGKIFYYDGYPPHYGRFSGTDTPVIEGDDDLDPICGAFDAKAPVQVGGFNLRLSGWGMLCDGDTSTSRNDFTPGTNFDIDQPGNGVQAGIPGNVPFNISARSEYTSVRGTLGVGGVLAQNGNVLFSGEVLFGVKTSESESEGKFQSDAFAGGFQTTSTQELDETSFGVGYRGEYVWSPNGVNVPDTGLQTVSVSVLGGVNFQDIDGSDRFFSTQGANVLGDVRRSLSANKNTFYYGVNGSVRFGTGGGTALTFTGFYNSDEMAFVELDFDGPSRIEFDRVDYAGVMAKFTVPLGMPGLTQSDARLKTDIKHLTTLENGLKLYAFKYLWDETVQVGLMAQDLLVDDTHKSAVVTMANGFYAVDYRSLGLKMATMDQWQARGVTAVMY